MEEVDLEAIDVVPETIIPERYKLWIMTFGCAHNFSDGEYMKVHHYISRLSIGYFSRLWFPFYRKPRRSRIMVCATNQW